MALLTRIKPHEYAKLLPDDDCVYLGEYIAGGSYRASETNQRIYNLKKAPNSSPSELRHKAAAIDWWADLIAKSLNIPRCAESATLIPAPPSKTFGHPEFDDRMTRVLNAVGVRHPNLDIRRVLLATKDRPSQHAGSRLTIGEIQDCMSVDYTTLRTSLRSRLIVVDDVFTQGGTFAAMRNMLGVLPGITVVRGLFLAKTVWPSATDDFSALP